MKKYTISPKKCRNCGGLISWDDYPATRYPIHVDASGVPIGTGSCPKYHTQIQTQTSPVKHNIPVKRTTPPIRKKPLVKHKTYGKQSSRKSTITVSPALLAIIAIGSIAGVILPFTFISATYQPYHPYEPPEYPETPEEPFQWEIDSQGTVTNIVDGDTYDLSSIGRIRLADIDCPDQGEAGCQAATDYLTSLINGEYVYVDIDDVYQTDVYGRYVVVTYVRYNSTHLLNVNKDLLVRGYAVI